MNAYLRAEVIELMLPAVPYILRFNISDYTYFTDYVRDKCLSGIYKRGLYEKYLESCEELKDHLLKYQGKNNEKVHFWTIEKLADENITPLSKEPGTWDPRMWGLESAAQTIEEATAAVEEAAAEVKRIQEEIDALEDEPCPNEEGAKAANKQAKNETLHEPAGDSATAGGAAAQALRGTLQAAQNAYNSAGQELAAAQAAEQNMSLYQQYMQVYEEGPEKATAFLKEWRRIEQQKAKINFEEGENSPLMPDSGLAVDQGKGGKKTPYMLSNFYGNVYPIGAKHLDAQIDEDSIWDSLGSWLMGIKMFSVNGIPMTPAKALKAALIRLCINPAFFEQGWLNNTSGNMTPSRAGDWGALGFQAFAKPPMIVPSDLLDALIVLECTQFIQRIKSLKADPNEDWDWPIDFSDEFFSRLLPKAPTLNRVMQFLDNPDTANEEDEQIRQLMFPQRIMYVPVLDTQLGGDLLSKEAFLKNFPWDFKQSMLADGTLDREEAKEMVAQPKFDPNTGIPIITETLGAYEVLTKRKQFTPKLPFAGGWMSPHVTLPHLDNHFMFLKGGLPGILYKTQLGSVTYGTDEAKISKWDDGFVADKYNGSAQFHMKTAGFVLQLYAYIDSYLWERIDEETLETVETPGLRNLLYLFGNRSYNLKGAVNPHYWNACMKDFFDHLDEKTTGTALKYTPEDLQKFKNRMGAEYANVKMGLRLCWMVPSGMPGVFDKMDPQTGKVWWDEAEYGWSELIDSYKQIPNDSEMREKFMYEKCHAYVVNHKQHKVTWQESDKSTPEPGDIIEHTLKEEMDIKEYAFCFPLVEVLSDQPAILDPDNWNIMPESLSLKRNPDHLVNSLIKKMAKDEDFRVLFEYIFPIKSIIPEIATIYGMEFFKPVSDYMKTVKNYFGPVKEASSKMIAQYEDLMYPDTSQAEDA